MANRSLIRIAAVCCWATASVCAAEAAAAQCRLCADGGTNVEKPARPISVDVDASLDFSRIAIVAANVGGAAALDAATGERSVSGALIGLTGLPFQGAVTVRGEPDQHIIVTLPAQVTLSTTGGSTIALGNFVTTLGSNPKLGRDGVLTFTFGGRLLIDGRSDGDFRGSVPITVEYR